MKCKASTVSEFINQLGEPGANHCNAGKWNVCLGKDLLFWGSRSGMESVHLPVQSARVASGVWKIGRIYVQALNLETSF